MSKNLFIDLQRLVMKRNSFKNKIACGESLTGKLPPKMARDNVKVQKQLPFNSFGRVESLGSEPLGNFGAVGSFPGVGAKSNDRL
jgi:hypothetical protein